MRRTTPWLTIMLLSLIYLGAGPSLSNPITPFSASDGSMDGWTINDTVMGGRSSSQWITKAGETPRFEGLLSLENNGGFTSVRSGAVVTPASSHTGIHLKVVGDGRSYKFVLRTNRARQGISYQHEFKTVAAGRTEVYLPFAAFIPRWRGMQVTGAPNLLPQDVVSVGFLLADKKPGPFRLEVLAIRATTAQ